VSRRDRIAREFVEAQRRDLVALPSAPRVVRPGSFGTYAQETRQGGPRAPTLDHGPVYTGEDREEIDGTFLEVDDSSVTPGYTILATLRRPWPFVGFVVDVSKVPDTFNVKAGLVVITRSGPARLVANVVGALAVPAPIPEIQLVTPAAPFPMLGFSGVYAGARVGIYVIQTGGDHPATVEIRGNLWGYNAPGYGP
jgi:hypothetical protein